MPNEDDFSSQPLLPRDEESNESPSFRSSYHRAQARAQRFLTSKYQHHLVLGLVTLDVLSILGEVFISLYTCEHGFANSWDRTRERLGIASLVFSCLFLLELLLSVWAFGWGYFFPWFHVFDASVILAGFIIDVLLHGILEEVASLVVILRLWRFFKIIEEFSVGANEQIEGLKTKVEKLERENAGLRRRLRDAKVGYEEQEVGYRQNE